VQPRKVFYLIQKVLQRNTPLKSSMEIAQPTEVDDNTFAEAALFLTKQGNIVGAVHLNNPHEFKLLYDDICLADLISKQKHVQFTQYVQKLQTNNAYNDAFSFKMANVYDRNKAGVITPLRNSHEQLLAFLLFIMKDQNINKVEKSDVEKLVQQTNDKHYFTITDTNKSMEQESDYISSSLRQLLRQLNDQDVRVKNLFVSSALPRIRKRLQDRYELLRYSDYLEHQFPIHGRNGKIEWVHERVITCKDGVGRTMFRFYHLKNEGVDEVVQHIPSFELNPVTKLPGTKALHQKIDELLIEETNEQFALLYLNIENFHWIDDYLGKHVSDAVIREIVERTKSLIGEDGFIAQLQKDSFSIILEKYESKEAVYTLSEELIERICKKLVVEEYEFYVSSTVGISFYPESGDNKYKLLENAHTALYQAKQLGKNNYEPYTNNRRDIASYKRIVLEKDLLAAMEEGDIELFYQPKINPLNNRIVGAEALLRWNHRDWGLISPGEFIPLAEKTNVMHELEDWVITSVCQQIRMWTRELKAICPISINISPTRLMKRGVDEFFKQQIEVNKIDPELLEIEVTENTLLKNNDIVQTTLTNLRNLGIKIALDDFGTGYSTFHYLSNFSVDTLKIDRSFIENLHDTNEKNEKILLSMLFLAKELDLEIVAEGVEDEDQLTFLKQKNFDLVQGHIYSEAVQAKTFINMLERGYVQPKAKSTNKENTIKRKYYRYEFTNFLLGDMEVIEINSKRVNAGAANVLIQNVSIGGLKFLSPLRLPVYSSIKFQFSFQLMGECYDLAGMIVNMNEEAAGIYGYGVAFDIAESEKDRIAHAINKMTVLKRHNKSIPQTNFIKDSPGMFFKGELVDVAKNV